MIKNMYNSYPTKEVVTNDKSSHECIHFEVFLYKKRLYRKVCCDFNPQNTRGFSY